jgi:hypothetical protein
VDEDEELAVKNVALGIPTSGKVGSKPTYLYATVDAPDGR